MILTIYALFFAISLVILFLGYYSGTDTLKIGGFMFIFLLGVALFQGDVEYRSGENATVTGNETLTVYSYTGYEHHTFGVYTAIIAMLGFMAVFLDYRARRRVEP